MKDRKADSALISKLFFRLLPIQVLLCVVNSVNGIVSSLFASNCVGQDSMSAMGLYWPLNMFIGAIAGLLMGGGQIMCGLYMGQNKQDRTRNVFSWDMVISTGFGLLMTALVLGAAFFGTGIFTADPAVQKELRGYLLGQAVGVLPLVLSQQFSAFLSLENKARRTTTAGVVYIVVNLVLNYLFVVVLGLGTFGLALASSLGMWVFVVVQAQYYFSGKSMFRLFRKPSGLKDFRDILVKGYPGALSNIYQTVRGLIVNALILAYVGNVGISAFTASDSVLRIIWAFPAGVVAVSRMLMSISVGEEDRKSLVDAMRVALYRCIPIQCAISALLIVLAVPLTCLFYRDPSQPVFQMTVNSFRIMPLCMPLSMICMHFVCYAQISGKQFLVHLLSVLDGVVCVAGFSALLIPLMKMDGNYWSNPLNGIVCALVVLGYSWAVRKRFPRNTEQLMVVPDDFGVGENARIDISVRDLSEVMSVSGQVIDFCRSRGIDERRASMSGLFLEEMAGNVVAHGFTKDKKKHTVDIRVVHKEDDIILRIKDDCTAFDPGERVSAVDPEDRVKGVGIRMVFRIAKDVKYQNMLGLNVVTIRI